MEMLMVCIWVCSNYPFMHEWILGLSSNSPINVGFNVSAYDSYPFYFSHFDNSYYFLPDSINQAPAYSWVYYHNIVHGEGFFHGNLSGNCSYGACDWWKP